MLWLIFSWSLLFVFSSLTFTIYYMIFERNFFSKIFYFHFYHLSCHKQYLRKLWTDFDYSTFIWNVRHSQSLHIAFEIKIFLSYTEIVHIVCREKKSNRQEKPAEHWIRFHIKRKRQPTQIKEIVVRAFWNTT